jgi:hypothetical protein
MHDAAAVGVAERVRDLAHAAQNRVGGCTRGAVEALLQGYAAHERHDEEGDPVFRIEVVHTHDVGMFERGAERRLAPEPLAPHRAGGDFGG